MLGDLEKRLHKNNTRKWKTDRHIADKFLNFDLYGKPVSLTFQGNEKFRTSVGAVITIMVSIFLIGFGAFRWLSYTDANLSQITMHR